MRYLRVRNWERYQHYGDRRRPPWIKLYNDLLDDPEFVALPDAARAHLVGIFLLASRYDNELPADPEWISRKLHATEPVELELLHHFLCGADDVASRNASESASSALSSLSLSTSGSGSGGRGGCRGEKGGDVGAEPTADTGAEPVVGPSAELGAGEEPASGAEPDTEDLDDVRSVLGYLNDLLGTAYVPGPDSRYLEERLAEGWSLEACEHVIEAAMARRDELGDLQPQRVFSKHWFSELHAQGATGKASRDWLETLDAGERESVTA